MKKRYYIASLSALFLILSVFISSAFAHPSLQNIHQRMLDGVILPGEGYSTDAQQVAPYVCYNVTTSDSTDGSTILSLSSSTSFSDLQDDLHVNVTASGDYGAFSANVEADYMRSVEDKEYSLSLNYYEYSSGTVSLQPDLAQPLNDNGQVEYEVKNRKYFGVNCGDQFISSYQEGAMLLMALNIDFSSEYEKDQFEEDAGASFGDIVSASEQIQETATKYNMTGSVSIQAYQKGGDPSQLSKILGPDSSGNYDALTCSLQNMDACVSAAEQLLDYASNDFSGQFSYSPATNLTPLGTGFATTTSIESLGLKVSESLVDSTVQSNRKYLSSMLQQYQYYQQKYHQLLEGYPVLWDATSDVYTTSEVLSDEATTNVDKIMSPSNPAMGGLACYDDLYEDDPNNCNHIAASINEYLDEHAITADDLGYLEPIKYYAEKPNGWYFYNGDSANANYGGDGQDHNNCPITSIQNFSLTSTEYKMQATSKCSNDGYGTFWYDGKSTDGGTTYVGTYGDTNGVNKTQTTYREVSPYYFTAYAPSASKSKKK